SPEARSEEHTSELQSRFDLVCRLLLEKKKQHSKQQADVRSSFHETECAGHGNPGCCSRVRTNREATGAALTTALAQSIVGFISVAQCRSFLTTGAFTQKG